MKAKLIKRKETFKSLAVVVLLPVMLVAFYGFAARAYVEHQSPESDSFASSNIE